MERNMKKRNWLVFQAILMILAVLVFASVFSCKKDDDGPKVGNVVGTFTGTDTNGKVCTLQIKDDDTYEFFIDGNSISTGTLSKNNDTYTLTANGGGEPFTVTVKGNKITGITGIITPDDGTDPITPGEIVEFKTVAGNWTWALSDDADPNDYKGAKQSIFSPGGASRITNAQEDPDETDRFGHPVKRPFTYPEGTVMDIDGNPINVPVFNFTGNTKVLKDNRTANEGARFPLVGWEAVPDEETLALLKTAYGYSFWVRLNSSTASNWAFLTAVVTDFEPEEGYEYKHWFGNKPGDSGGSKINNFTSKLQVGTWYQIKVIMNKDAFNMDEDGWLYKYPPTPDPKKPFNQAAAEKIQWQIPLQHQDGASVKDRGKDPYDMITGSYAFNVDFYGLELLNE
jgi:hypothetical protein